MAAAGWGAPQVLVVAGLGGEADYATAFVDQAQRVARAAESVGADVTLLVGDEARGEDIRRALAELASAGGTARWVVTLIGHGSYDGEAYRFNVPGPDPTAHDLAAWLAPVPAAPQLVVLATSSSGAAVEVLKSEERERAVVSATRDGGEQNAVVFGGFWAAALGEPRADVDKNGRIDADEAFAFAEQAVAAHYEDAQRIATEHPRTEGALAGFPLATLAGRADATPAAAGRRAELLAEVDALRDAKDDYAEEDYFAALQELLLELAALERQRDPQ